MSVTIKRIPLAVPAMNGNEMRYVEDAFRTNWIAPLGPNVDAFEVAVTSYVGRRHGAALSSGTAAIHLALKAVGVGKGDLVFCSALTFAASCNPIMYQDATPVFIDSDADSWCMSPVALRRAFEVYPCPKAVIVVNLYGTASRLDEIAEICHQYGVPLIEDAAESLGSTYKGRQTGTFGDLGVFSFNGNKIITTSGGGMLVSEKEEIIAKVHFWATQARDPARHYQHSELGYNYRMSNICAGIGRGQLETLDLRISQKGEIYRRYQEGFSDCTWLHMNPIPKGCASNHWLSCLTVGEGCPVSALEIIEELEKHNIESRPIWKPMNLQPYYQKYPFVSHRPQGQGSEGEDIFKNGLCLPSDVNMTIEEQQRVIGVIRGLCTQSTAVCMQKLIPVGV